jgi:tryptophanyl-tRNA synthetase
LATSLEHTHLQLVVENLKLELAAIKSKEGATQESKLAMQGMLEECKKRDAEVRKDVREAEERVGKVKGEVAAVMDRVVKETEGKFRRVLTLDA